MTDFLIIKTVKKIRQYKFKKIGTSFGLSTWLPLFYFFFSFELPAEIDDRPRTSLPIGSRADFDTRLLLLFKYVHETWSF